MFSIAGLLPLPTVGLASYYMPDADPSTAIGCTLGGGSYILAGETTRFDNTDQSVLSVRRSIERIRSLAKTATRLTIDMAVARANHKDTADLEKLRRETELAIDNEESHYHDLTNKAGLVVARWSASETQNGSAMFGPVFTAHGGEDTATSGFIILSGIRLVSLVLSDDLFTRIQTLVHDGVIPADVIAYANITTYLLQAKWVAFTNEQSHHSVIDLAMDVKLENLRAVEALLSDIDHVKLGYYAASYRNLDTSGAVGGMQWRAHPISLNQDAGINGAKMVLGIDTVTATRAPDFELAEFQQPESSWKDLVVKDGWSTVVARNSMPGKWARVFMDFYLKPGPHQPVATP